MRGTLTHKILEEHLVEGDLRPGGDIAIRIAQTLTQDATGTMAMLHFAALGRRRVSTELSVSYVDHNTLQTGFENSDDHLFLQTSAAKYGIVFSPPGNGVSHQLHLENFAAPGKTLLGSDSHTPTAGGIGMLAIGAGGLDVAAAMAGRPFYLKTPKVTLIRLAGKLGPRVGAKDVILHILGLLSVSGGVGKIIEYGGNGVATLSVPQRATITNMGAELGATTSVFPSDRVTMDYLARRGRDEKWIKLAADSEADYDEIIDVRLSDIVPMVAKPHSPDNVAPVKEIQGLPVQQVIVGSCTNSSYDDLMHVAAIVKGKKVHPDTSFVISPGSRDVLQAIIESGALADLLAAGARILEPACGPCIGMGLAPPSGGVTVRTFNRNFEGRSGVADAGIYLVGPETAAITALTGQLTDPQTLDDPDETEYNLPISSSVANFYAPSTQPESIEIRFGPNIKPLPDMPPPPDSLKVEILLKTGDNVTTDHIMPAGAKILPLRSNIPAISEHVFASLAPGFAKKAKEKGGGVILGGENYGQGSSREHAALAPRALGVRAALALSFARIHRNNLINFGIIPMIVAKDVYENLKEDDTLEFSDLRRALREKASLTFQCGARTFAAGLDLSERERGILLAGGLISFIREND
jgi:predicted aconitate hydratase